jgi:Protein of unknown function (DUF4236)
MGFRFGKRIKIFPGVRLNLSKRGPSSVSIGGHGYTHNIGKHGRSDTFSLGGTGLSFRTTNSPPHGLPQQQRHGWSIIGTISRLIVAIPIFLLCMMLCTCTSPRTPKTTAFVPHYKTVPVPTPYGYK